MTEEYIELMSMEQQLTFDEEVLIRSKYYIWC
jgi:hypothetical protein